MKSLLGICVLCSILASCGSSSTLTSSQEQSALQGAWSGSSVGIGSEANGYTGTATLTVIGSMGSLSIPSACPVTFNVPLTMQPGKALAGSQLSANGVPYANGYGPPSAKASLLKEVKQLPVTLTWFQYNVNDIEAFTFGNDIAEVLRAGGWNPTDVEPIMKMTEGPVPLGTAPSPQRGVVISTTGQKSNEEAANALMKALISLGFDCKRSPLPAIRDPKWPNTVFVFIEPRPEGRQGEAKLTAEARKRHALTKTN